ncbi:MAG: mannitol dehydrogenase family protein [Pseudomonadota bacterium]
MSTVLHLGLGNFHRAHQAWYTAQAPGGWSILGVSLRSATVRDALAAAGWRYTLAIKDHTGARYETLDVLRGVLVASESPEAVLDALASPDTACVTITVTEKGYTLDAEGELDAHHPDVQHDLQSPSPRTLIGYLARGLARRAAQRAPAITVLSCDNLPGNGRKLRRAVGRFCALAGIDLPLASISAFPDSMVDRITPATTAALEAECELHATGPSRAAVETERFSEWVIERRTVGTLPNWGAAGVQWVDDVAPFEQRKLRLLNGTHSLMAHLGRRRGHTFVHEAIADPVVEAAVDALMAEAGDTLAGPAADGVGAYCSALKTRYANPALRHALAQIAVDSSIKLGVRVAPVLLERAAQGLPSPACYRALAAWVAQSAADIARGVGVADPALTALQVALGVGRSRAEQVRAALTLISPSLGAVAHVDGVVSAWPDPLA